MTDDTSTLGSPMDSALGGARSLPTASGRVQMKRAAWTLAGAAGGAYGLLATLSYSPNDPSLNVAGVGEPSNLLGAPGALFADLAVQTMGAAAPVALAAIATAGVVRIARKRMSNPISPARLASGAAGVALLAGLASFIPTPAAWGLGAGFGGVLGDTMNGLFTGTIGLTGLPLAEVFSGLALGVGGLGALGWAFRLTKDDVRSAADVAGRAMTAVGGEAKGALAGAMARLQDRRNAAPDRPWRDDDAPMDQDGLDDLTFAPAPQPPEGQSYRRLDPDAEAAPAPRPQPRPAPAAQAPIQREPTPPRAPAPRAAPQPAPRAQQTEMSFPSNGRGFRLPPIDHLSPPKPRAVQADGVTLKQMSQRLAGVLEDFGVQGEIVAARPGPVVTLFEFEPAPGVKSARVVGLADDIARSMSATSARVAVIPGRNAIGIELPNDKRETVYLRGLLSSNSFIGNQGGLPLALGETIEGEPCAADLTKMPHLLIAGTTGSGKSVGINAMILSLLYRLTPEQCRFIMIDPKMIELSAYSGIPHLLAPVVTDPKDAVVALKWTVREMEERYRKLAKLGVRNISGYNERMAEAIATGEPIERTVSTGVDPDTGEQLYGIETIEPEQMPYLVVVIDELADLMLTAGKEVEPALQRLAQMARAAGIHLLMATQRPSVDVITGTIKANFPTRISYAVTSKIDSRTILGEQGAEQLLGMGDLLYMAGGGRIQRLHGPFVTDREVERVVEMLKAQGKPNYLPEVLEDPDAPREIEGFDEEPENGGDELYDEAVAIVARERRVSISYIQRCLEIGYNRAAKMVERMERQGVVSRPYSGGKRDVLIPPPVE
jgi:S-DNA-T family DNA segregation ATPase FtsK/SpoIIIE